MCRVISIYRGKLKITISRGTLSAGGFTFSGDDLRVLATAADQVDDPKVHCVAKLTTSIGHTIEVGAGGGAVHLRRTVPGGLPKKATPLRDLELAALRAALSDLGVKPFRSKESP